MVEALIISDKASNEVFELKTCSAVTIKGDTKENNETTMNAECEALFPTVFAA